jgi:hypothetical protein
MTRITPSPAIYSVVLATLPWAACSLAADLPSLDEMASEWLPLSTVANPPDVNNFHHMLIVNRDLTSYFCHPGGLFTQTKDPTCQWRAGYPLVKLTLDGVEYPAADVRWYAYRALRRNLDCAGVAVETDTRMVNEQRGVLCRITLTNTTNAPRTIQLALRVPGKLDGDAGGVLNTTQNPRTISALQPSRKPDEITVEGNDVVWHWKMALPAGVAADVGFVAGDEARDKVADTRQKVATWAGHFAAEMSTFQSVWEKRWADAFAPGNRHFSGNLPVLKTDAMALRRNYYMGALTMLCMERTQFPIHRAFITSGERSEGIQYFWDASMGATAWALLEPTDMKAVLRRWLVQNPRGGVHISLRDAHGYDPKHYDAISGYAANACAVFQTADVYLRVTGDGAFLDEKLENGKTVLDSLDALATDWETLPKGPGGLVNYGNNGKLLETAPLYAECVASVNAQNVWMMRKAADLQQFKGHEVRAVELRKKAGAFLPVVLSLYNNVTGAWNARRLDGAVVPVQHCFDFIYAANALADDLTAAHKLRMNSFAKREILTRNWMRAMSLKDPDVPRATRPDHSYTGSYDGWIPLTAGAMWRLGDRQGAYEFYCRTAEVTKEGPFAQAHEFYGPDPTSDNAPVRIAMRGSNMKECISGAAFADVVINTFFGFMPSVGGKKLLVDASAPRPFSAALLNVRQGKSFYTISADETGLKLTPQLVVRDPARNEAY